MRILASCIVATLFFALPVRAQTQQTVTLVADAPVFVTPNTHQTPLRVGKKGSVLALVDVTNDWVHVRFEDPDYGRRWGYVQRRFVKIGGAAISSR